MAKRPSNRLVRKAIREIMEPQIAALGFTGKYPEFRRDLGGETHFLLFQTAKYGGAFGVSGAWGNLREFEGKEPSLAATAFEHRASLTRRIDLWRLDGTPFAFRPKMFDYTFIVEDAAACEALVDEAANALPELLQWFETKKLTEGLDTVFDKVNSAPNPDLGRLIARAKVEQGLY